MAQHTVLIPPRQLVEGTQCIPPQRRGEILAPLQGGGMRMLTCNELSHTQTLASTCPPVRGGASLLAPRSMRAIKLRWFCLRGCACSVCGLSCCETRTDTEHQVSLCCRCRAFKGKMQLWRVSTKQRHRMAWLHHRRACSCQVRKGGPGPKPSC